MFQRCCKVTEKIWNSKHSRQNLAENGVKTLIPHPFFTRTLTLKTFFHSISCSEKVTV